MQNWPPCRLVIITILGIGFIIGKVGIMVCVNSGKAIPTELWGSLAVTLAALTYVVYRNGVPPSPPPPPAPPQCP